MEFKFEGVMPASKSIMNRGLIIQSYNSDVRVSGETSCEDVHHMKEALLRLEQGQSEFHCGDAGTTLRFLLARLSRKEGKWTLKGSQRLMSRPHKGVIEAVKQLGVDIKMIDNTYEIQSSGWQAPSEKVFIDCEKSSQFATAMVLNAWDLPFDLQLNLSTKKASEAYLVMSIMMAQSFGMVLRQQGEEGIFIPRGQTPKDKEYVAEPDFSSCFSIVGAALLGGAATINDFPERSIQPDRVFVPVLQGMGGRLFYDKQTLVVLKTENLRPIEVDLNNSPDLFPVLCVLLARANGDSLVTGLSQLAHKESDRLKNTIELIKRLGRSVKLEDNQLTIYGNPKAFSAEGDFDPDHDHRMAMAAQVANVGGAQFNILNPDVVNKSFPEFWSYFEMEHKTQ